MMKPVHHVLLMRTGAHLLARFVGLFLGGERSLRCRILGTVVLEMSVACSVACFAVADRVLM